MIFQDYWQILVRFVYLESRKPKAERRDKQTHPLSGI